MDDGGDTPAGPPGLADLERRLNSAHFDPQSRLALALALLSPEERAALGIECADASAAELEDVRGALWRIFPSRHRFLLDWITKALIHSAKPGKGAADGAPAAGTLHRDPRFVRFLAYMLEHEKIVPAVLASSAVYYGLLAVFRALAEDAAGDAAGRAADEALRVAREAYGVACSKFAASFRPPLEQHAPLVASLARALLARPAGAAAPFLAEALEAYGQGQRRQANQRKVFTVAVASLLEPLLALRHRFGAEAEGSPLRALADAAGSVLAGALFHPDQLSDYTLAFAPPEGEAGPAKKKPKGEGPARRITSYQRQLFDALAAQAGGAGLAAAAAALPWLLSSFVAAWRARFGRRSRQQKPAEEEQQPEADEEGEEDEEGAERKRRRPEATSADQPRVEFGFFRELVAIAEGAPEAGAGQEAVCALLEAAASEGVYLVQEDTRARAHTRFLEGLAARSAARAPAAPALRALGTLLRLNHALVEPHLPALLAALADGAGGDEGAALAAACCDAYARLRQMDRLHERLLVPALAAAGPSSLGALASPAFLRSYAAAARALPAGQAAACFSALLAACLGGKRLPPARPAALLASLLQNLAPSEHTAGGYRELAERARAELCAPALEAARKAVPPAARQPALAAALLVLDAAGDLCGRCDAAVAVPPAAPSSLLYPEDRSLLAVLAESAEGLEPPLALAALAYAARRVRDVARVPVPPAEDAEEGTRLAAALCGGLAVRPPDSAPCGVAGLEMGAPAGAQALGLPPAALPAARWALAAGCLAPLAALAPGPALDALAACAARLASAACGPARRLLASDAACEAPRFRSRILPAVLSRLSELAESAAGGASRRKAYGPLLEGLRAAAAVGPKGKAPGGPPFPCALPPAPPEGTPPPPGLDAACPPLRAALALLSDPEDAIPPELFHPRQRRAAAWACLCLLRLAGSRAPLAAACLAALRQLAAHDPASLLGALTEDALLELFRVPPRALLADDDCRRELLALAAAAAAGEGGTPLCDAFVADAMEAVDSDDADEAEAGYRLGLARVAVEAALARESTPRAPLKPIKRLWRRLFACGPPRPGVRPAVFDLAASLLRYAAGPAAVRGYRPGAPPTEAEAEPEAAVPDAAVEEAAPAEAQAAPEAESKKKKRKRKGGKEDDEDEDEEEEEEGEEELPSFMKKGEEEEEEEGDEAEEPPPEEEEVPDAGEVEGDVVEEEEEGREPGAAEGQAEGERRRRKAAGRAAAAARGRLDEAWGALEPAGAEGDAAGRESAARLAETECALFRSLRPSAPLAEFQALLSRALAGFAAGAPLAAAVESLFATATREQLPAAARLLRAALRSALEACDWPRLARAAAACERLAALPRGPRRARALARHLPPLAIALASSAQWVAAHGGGGPPAADAHVALLAAAAAVAARERAAALSTSDVAALLCGLCPLPEGVPPAAHSAAYRLLYALLRHRTPQALRCLPHLVSCARALLFALGPASPPALFRDVARLYEELARSRSAARKYCPHLLADFLAYATGAGVAPERRRLLLPGVFALMEACSDHEFKQLFVALGPADRALFRTTHAEFVRDYKYTGKV